jgi:hypothetical protein
MEGKEGMEEKKVGDAYFYTGSVLKKVGDAYFYIGSV